MSTCGLHILVAIFAKLDSECSVKYSCICVQIAEIMFRNCPSAMSDRDITIGHLDFTRIHTSVEKVNNKNKSQWHLKFRSKRPRKRPAYSVVSNIARSGKGNLINQESRQNRVNEIPIPNGMSYVQGDKLGNLTSATSGKLLYQKRKDSNEVRKFFEHVQAIVSFDERFFRV